MKSVWSLVTTFSVAVLALGSFPSAVLADGDVILNPGTIQGTVRIGNSSETAFAIVDISAYWYPGDGTYKWASKRVNFPTGSETHEYDYDLTVDLGDLAPGETADYEVYVWVNFPRASAGDPYTYYQGYVNFAEQEALVSDTVPGVADFIIDNPGFVELDFSINGDGELDYADLSANPTSTSPDNHQSSLTFYGFQTAPLRRVVVQPGEYNLSTTVVFDSGARVGPFEETVTVGPGWVVPYVLEVDTPPPGTIEGDIQFSGPAEVGQYQVSVSGPASVYEYISGPFTDNMSPYSLEVPGGSTDEPIGPYYQSARAYINYDSSISWYDDELYFPASVFDPDNRPYVIADEATDVDIYAEQSFINGIITLTGPGGWDDVSQCRMSFQGVYGTPSENGTSWDRCSLGTGVYNNIVTPGPWQTSSLQLNYYRSNGVDPYFSQYLYLYDKRFQAGNAFDLDPGETETQNFEYSTGEVTIRFTVAGGGTLSDPRIYGNCVYEIEPPGGGDLEEIWRYNLGSSTQDQEDVTEGVVTFVGMAGLCTLDARAKVGDTEVSFGQVELEVLPGSSQDIDIGGPSLTVETPMPDICVTGDVLTVSGLVTDDQGVASVVVNGVTAALTGTGNPDDPNEMEFSAEVPMPGDPAVPFEVVTVATDTADKQATDTRSVQWSPDSDDDQVPDCDDGCPNDPFKVEPGICGCGESDADSDDDDVIDCEDGCPNDPEKVEPGICGCGEADLDLDEDEVIDCQEECPEDPNKTSAGACGCGVPDTDSDGDDVADCNDQCVDDPNKSAPGQCGCGAPDTDSDGDGTADCVETEDKDPVCVEQDVSRDVNSLGFKLRNQWRLARKIVRLESNRRVRARYRSELYSLYQSGTFAVESLPVTVFDCPSQVLCTNTSYSAYLSDISLVGKEMLKRSRKLVARSLRQSNDGECESDAENCRKRVHRRYVKAQRKRRQSIARYNKLMQDLTEVSYFNQVCL